MASCWAERAVCAVGFGVVTTWSLVSSAQVSERFAVDQRGDFVLIGNTLAQDCAPIIADPVQGEVGNCGESSGDTGADVLWSLDADGVLASADTGVSPDEASSIAVLALPAGATVTRADLYWSARAGAGDEGLALLSRGSASVSVVADATSDAIADDNDYYQSVADVTEFVREQGAGAFQVSGIVTADPVGLDDTSYYAGWWLVVFYALGSEPVRHLALYDGFALVGEETPASATLASFEVPPSGIDGKLGVVAFDGDASLDGDELRFGPLAPLGAGSAQGGSDNFFDGSRRSPSGAPLSTPGDLPQTTGDANSLSGVDLHVLDIAATLAAGQTSAEVLALTGAGGDRFFLSGLVLSVATTSPDLTASTQTVVDVGGPPLRPGDELEYTVTISNAGTGASPEVTLNVPLPASVRYVPGSLQVVSGATPGGLTDAAGDDAGELDASSGATLVVRVGDGADGARGGRLGAGESVVVSYRVALAADASGVISSQAQVRWVPAPGQAAIVSLTDADLLAPGVTPTESGVDDCASDVDCGKAGHCDLSQSPQRCVECLVDAHCPGLAPSCDPGRACACVPSGPEALCDGRDDDCDGAIDEDLAGLACSAGEGLCPVDGITACDGQGGVLCDVSASAAPTGLCTNGVDDDCDGAADALDDECAGGTPSGAGSEAPASGTFGVPLDPEAGAPATPTSRPEPTALAPERAEPVFAPGGSSAASLGGGGGGCRLVSGGARTGPAPWWAVAAALAWGARRRARRSSPPATPTSA